MMGVLIRSNKTCRVWTGQQAVGWCTCKDQMGRVPKQATTRQWMQVGFLLAHNHVRSHAVCWSAGDATMLTQQVGRVQTFDAVFATCFACFVSSTCAFHDTPQNNSCP
ncbi:TPA: hypothetical protein ACH3X1_010210 [Trebouxia sp. C0004]